MKRSVYKWNIKDPRCSTNVINIYLKSTSKVDQNLTKCYLEKKLNIFSFLIKKHSLVKKYNRRRTSNPGIYSSCFGYKIIDLPVNIRKLTLLKSPHVHKKAKQHFIQTQYTTLIKIKLYPSDTLDYRNHEYDFESRLKILFGQFIANCPNSVKLSVTWEKIDNFSFIKDEERKEKLNSIDPYHRRYNRFMQRFFSMLLEKLKEIEKSRKIRIF